MTPSEAAGRGAVRYFALRPEDLENLREICAPALDWGASLADITGHQVVSDQEVPPETLRVVGHGCFTDYPLNWVTLDSLLRPWNERAEG